MDIEWKRSTMDYACDISLGMLVFVLFTFSTNAKPLFLPLEILFIGLFGARFLIQKSKLSLYAVWSIGLAMIAGISTLYAPIQEVATKWAISVFQVVIFGNLMVPYLRSSQRNMHVMLYSFLIAVVGLSVRLLLSAPIEVLLKSRLGTTIGMNANHVGFLLVAGALIALYFGITKKGWWLLPLFVGFSLFSLFSGSRKVIALLGMGSLLLIILSRKNYIHMLIASVICLFFAVGVIAITLHWEPLYQILGRRVESFLGFFSTGTTDGSTSIRFEMIQHGWEMFLEKPFFGWGLHAFTDISGYGFYSHNNYIEILVSWGLFGFLWYYLPILALLVIGVKNLLRKKSSKLAAFSVAILTALLVDDFGRVRFFDEATHFLYAISYVAIMWEYPQKGLDILTLAKKLVYTLTPPKFRSHSSFTPKHINDTL
nr:O-antigen ligase family protein [uncultured Sphaerochaeta sp.]